MAYASRQLGGRISLAVLRMSIPRDVKEFLDGYPDNENDTSSSANLDFYSNNLRCKPDNRLIDEIHEQ